MTSPPDEAPERLRKNWDEAIEMTRNLKDAIYQTNSLLEHRDMDDKKLPIISGRTIPPDLDDAQEIFDDARGLSAYLANHHADDKKLRSMVIAVEQILLELNEFIYKDTP
jgi:hypothetical protein